MTDAQKAELTRLAREAREAADRYVAANAIAEEALAMSNAADKMLADAMWTAGLRRLVLDGILFHREEEDEIATYKVVTLP